MTVTDSHVDRKQFLQFCWAYLKYFQGNISRDFQKDHINMSGGSFSLEKELKG